MALSDFLVSLVTFIAIYGLFGLGLNLKFGFTGLIDFGHVAYFMVGGYVTAVVTMPAQVTGYDGLGGYALPALLGGVPGGAIAGWLLGVAVGMLAAAFVSLLVGVPTLRLREDYLAITALGIATILNEVVLSEVWLFNGPFGIRSIHEPAAGLFPLGLGSFTTNLVVFGGLSVLVFGYAAYRLAAYVRRSSGRQRALAVAVAVAFSLWYFVQPLLGATNAVVALQTNVTFLFDPNAGPNGGLDYDRFFMLLSLSFLAAGYWWCQRTINSPYGRVLRAVRDDEDVPRALGKETFRYKIQALLFGSALAGAAGALYTIHIGFISPDQFGAMITFFAFASVIIGGTANNAGVVLGTAVFWAINSGTQFLNDYFPSEYAVQLAAARLILIGVILIVILYYRPEGVLGEQDYDVSLPKSDAPAPNPDEALGGESDD
ncbi:branched-chain amino acid ABC transporter permease [Halorubellus sp. JP-L1]|uniref:branched-chain amino acid ABC transporter permease n=1 Tax=Halorubellus sp. JP-L1 TaxID=2715753 RepID=UPI0014076318|nr:branched-chain amino acid ABC transporter permease [Halorubellus sp. JP-L1]NHN40250.1 branched-chain amino acid ABC transporter permease [Halorubellus sp. JP-L1]